MFRLLLRLWWDNICLMLFKKGPIYLSGPMRRRAGNNHALFNKVAAEWRALGWVVINPAENFGGDYSGPREKLMRLDFKHMLKARAIGMLPEWQDSPGAVTEHLMAAGLDLPVYDAITKKLIDARSCLMSHHTVKEIIERISNDKT